MKLRDLPILMVLLTAYLCSGLPENASAADKGQPETRWKMGRTKITISGNYRLRGELQDEFQVKTFATGHTERFLLARLRFDTDIRFAQPLRLHFQIQDARVAGHSLSDADFAAGNHPFHDPLDINQAYVEFLPLRSVQFKIGRQAISFRDRRIFGPGDWGNTGRYAWDAAMITLTNRWLESTWLAGRFIRHDPDRWPNQWADGPTAFAGYYKFSTLPFSLDVVHVLKYDNRRSTAGEQGTGNLTSHSLGFWLNGQWQAWEYGISAVGQLGLWSSDDIRAYGWVGSLGYQWQTRWQPLLKLECIIGSGDSNPNDGIHGTFDGVFGGADTDLYGWMNLFFWQNLCEYRLDLRLAPHRTLLLKGEYHYFTLDQASDAWYFPGKALRRDKTGNSGRELGHEIDVSARIKVTKYLELLAGFGLFFPGKFVKNTGSSPRATWLFLETTFYF